MSDATKLTGAAAAKATARAERERKAAEEAAAAAAIEAEAKAREGAAPAEPTKHEYDGPERTPEEQAAFEAQLASDPLRAVASDVVRGIPDARLEEHLLVARHAAKHGGEPQQRLLEAEVARQIETRIAVRNAQRDEVAARAANVFGPAPLHSPSAPPVAGAAIPDDIKRGSTVLLHTAGAIPSQLATVLRRWPAASDGKRYQADLYVMPQISGSSGHTVEGATYGPGLNQFSELPADEDDWELDEGKTYDSVRTWQHV